jgi:hypothetical protein
MESSYEKTTTAPAMQLTKWGQQWYDTPPEIHLNTSVASPLGLNGLGLNGLADSKDVKTVQDALNTEARQQIRAASMWDATPGALFTDAQEALLGIPSDLLGQSERKSVGAIIGHGNRLRGIGVLLLLLGIAGAIIDWMLGTQTSPAIILD